MLALSDQEIDGLKLDADLAFPSQHRAGADEVASRAADAVIDDREVHVVQGTTARGATATLYFDMETGLLVRQVRYVDSPVGRIPTQIDYADYREVAGVKMPIRWTPDVAGRTRHVRDQGRAAERRDRRREVRAACCAREEIGSGSKARLASPGTGGL